MSKIISTTTRRHALIARLTVSAIAIAAAMPAIAQEAIIVGDGEVITDTVNLPNDGDNLTVDQGGTIDTDGVDAVNVAGDNAVVDNAGTVTVAGNGTTGILVSGDNATIAISGTVESSGGVDFATFSATNTVRIVGDAALITNTGVVSATGATADAIDIDGDGARFENAGTVSTTGFGGEGVRLDGDDIAMVNTGAISTSGLNAEGILISGDNARVENLGTVSTSTSSSDGVEFDGDNGTLINTGIIRTSNADGVEFNGNNGYIENSGQILTEGSFDEAIRLDGVGYAVLNTGLIQTSGQGSEALDIDDEAYIDNQGAIRTLGNNSDGIEVDGVDTFIHNSGLVETAGNEAEAVRLDGARGQLVNSGALRTTGAGADGVSMNGVNTSLVNSGIISATGDGSRAIVGDGDNQIVTLETGSQIRGAINLGGGEDTLNVGLIGSAVMEIAGVETLNVSDQLGVIDLGDRQVFVETTGLTALDGVTDAFAQSVHRSIDTQITTGTTGAWASIIAESGDRDGTDENLGFSHNFFGVTAGYELDLGTTRLGFVGGVASGELETDVTSYDIESDRAFGGAYVTVPTGFANITGSLLLGAEAHDATRIVADSAAGLQDATSDIDAQFVSAAVTARGRDYALGGVALRPVVSASFTQTNFDSYSETGEGDVNLSFDARSSQSTNLRALVEADYTLGTIQTTFRVGVDAGYTQADDVSGSFEDADFSVAAFNDDEETFGGFAGARAVLFGNDRVDVASDFEYRAADN
ncbi:MAG: autotransporter domain-containing protein, partial [Pseudomonadota bacterium]